MRGSLMQMALPPGWEARHSFSGSREFEELLKTSLPRVNLGRETRLRPPDSGGQSGYSVQFLPVQRSSG